MEIAVFSEDVANVYNFASSRSVEVEVEFRVRLIIPSFEEGAQTGSTEEGTQTGSTEEGTQTGSTEEGTQTGSTEEGTQTGSTASEGSETGSSATVAQWRRVGHLARIAVEEDSIVQLCAELNSILSFVEQLAEVDIEGVEPMTSATPMAMKKREDVVTDGGIPDDIVGNAPAAQDHYFVVPKVVE